MSNWYKEWFAKILSSNGEKFEKRVKPFKRKIFLNFEGKTLLEIGAGAGINLRYYQGAKKIYLVEPNRSMHKYILEKNEKSRLNIEILENNAENLPLLKNSVDIVVSTFVLCSVNNVPKTLKEISRVLKPHGKFIFIEHIASKKGFSKVVQILIRKPWSYIADGCDCHKRTEEIIRKSGLYKEIKIKYFYKVPTFFIKPLIVGSAKK